MARPKKPKESKLTKEVKTLANRARVRMQELKKEMKKTGKLPYTTLNEISNLQNSGLLTKSGNVSMKLPKTADKLKIVKSHLEKFLKGDTTRRDIKNYWKAVEEREKREKNKRDIEELKNYLQRQKEEERQREGEQYNEAFNERYEQANNPWAYWHIAKDYGLFTKVDYDKVKDKIDEIMDNMSIAEFESFVYNFMDNMASDDNPYIDDATNIFADTMGIDL